MKANKYKTLYSFQKESIKYLKSRNLALTKIDKICNLLNKKVKKFEFEFDGFKINSNKNLKNNKFVSILLQYSNNLVKIIQEDDKKRE